MINNGRNRRPPVYDNRFIIGHQIRSFKVICIDHENTNLGEIDTREALRLAELNGLDLVQVAPPANGKPPTCKILNFSKLKYETQKKDRAVAKRQRDNAVKIKEIKFRPSTGDNDLRIKAKQAQEFIEDGARVKITITFRGREISHQQVATSTLEKFINMISIAEIVQAPLLAGKSLVALVARKAEGLSA